MASLRSILLFAVMVHVIFHFDVGDCNWFLQITDVHYDMYYQANTDPATSCHRGVGNAGPFGHRGYCDSPLALVKGILSEISSGMTKDNSQVNFNNGSYPTPDFILWTGDNARHNNDPLLYRTEQELWSEVSTVSTLMAKNFPKISIVPAIGNNDIFPHDTLGPKEPKYQSWVLGNLTNFWKGFLSPDEISTFSTGGYYVRSFNSQLDIVSLNTIYWTKNDINGTSNCSVTSSVGLLQLQWLEKVLISAQSQGKGVLISGHIPPDPSFYFGDCYEQYVTISGTYKAVIVAHIYAHTHADQFMILRSISDPLQPAAGVVHVAPSVVPTFNPSIRWYQYTTPSSSPLSLAAKTSPSGAYSKSSKHGHSTNEVPSLLNYSQLYQNIDTANKNGALQLKQEYTAPSDLTKLVPQFQNLSLSSHQNLEDALLANIFALQQYIEYLSVSSLNISVYSSHKGGAGALSDIFRIPCGRTLDPSSPFCR